jgi:hypothetical protein
MRWGESGFESKKVDYWFDDRSGGGGGGGSSETVEAPVAQKPSRPALPELKAKIAKCYEAQRDAGAARSVRLLLLLFGMPESETVKKELVPRAKYWHHRSGVDSDLAAFGFSAQSSNDPGGSRFAEVLSEFESQLDWKYSGGTDLIVLNTRYDYGLRTLEFDFSSAVSLTVETAIKAGAIDDVSMFIESLLHFAREHKRGDLSWGFSDHMGIDKAKSALWNLVVSILPEALRDNAKGAKHFCVRDLKPRKSVDGRRHRRSDAFAPMTPDY